MDPVPESSPVQTLPPELVAEVFVHFLPTYPECPPLFGLLSPLLLCQICRRWRAIALSTPVLWRAIAFKLDDPQWLSHNLATLNAWLTRSGNCPLSLDLSRCNDVLRPFALDAIARHCERWGHLNVLVGPDDLHLMQDEMPLLRHLTFGPDGFYQRLSESHLFARAPSLRSVVLGVNFLAGCTPLPWAQLTHLEALCFYEHECTDVLREATQLVSCKLYVTPDDDEDTYDGAQVPVHNHLCELVLRARSNSNVWQWEILDKLTLPALRSLQIAQTNTDLDSLYAFLVRSRCMLQELHVTGAATMDESDLRVALPVLDTMPVEVAVYATSRPETM
ncbi:hypothetical protein C8R46DRAFT_1106177 [Mycena filopes]|nr:hypothetical protein C8R46DRAFT_1106177 [Mycena filopes]